jgi:hypothetical protein
MKSYVVCNIKHIIHSYLYLKPLFSTLYEMKIESTYTTATTNLLLSELQLEWNHLSIQQRH